MPKDKFGTELNWKEYFSRWKDGINKVTPLQQIKLQINSTYIMLIGILGGIIISIIGVKTLWWLLIILSAAFINTSVQLIGLYQKKFTFEYFENLDLKGGIEKMEGEEENKEEEKTEEKEE